MTLALTSPIIAVLTGKNRVKAALFEHLSKGVEDSVRRVEDNGST